MKGTALQIIEIRAELVEATGLTQISTIRNGVVHAVKWRPLSIDARTVAVDEAAVEEAAWIGTITRTSKSPVWLDWYSVWVEVE